MLPVDKQLLKDAMGKMHIADITTATIRQIVMLSKQVEATTGEEFIHLEMGNPGLPSVEIGVETECAALRGGIANKYPAIEGFPELKKNASDFLKAFFNLDVDPKYFIPTVGSMQGSFTTLMALKQRLEGKDSMLYLNPGFPAQRNQAKLLGINEISLDIYDYRGKPLEAKLDEILGKGNVTGILYSTPNNPAWTNLTEEELEIIGRMATKHDVIVVEDHAYVGMDFRKNFGIPYEPPYVPTVARYTDNYILLLSASKIFSYAGQRIACVCMSPAVYERKYPFFASYYEMPAFGDAYVYGILYCASSGTCHSAQYAMSALLKAAVEGSFNFVDYCHDYKERGHKARAAFLDNGFHLVYEKDGEETISDGFFFTVGYKDLTGEELQKELMRYGVATISLPSTGSLREGLRICVSTLTSEHLFEILNSRLKLFNEQH